MGSRSRMRRGNFGGKGHPLQSIGTLCHCGLCKNGWTDRFAIWLMDSGGPKEARVQSYLPGGANMPDGTLPWAVQKRLNRSICRLGCGLSWAKVSTSSIVFTRWRQCAHMGGHIDPTWQIRLNRPSAAAMRSYVTLFWPLVSLCFCQVASLLNFIVHLVTFYISHPPEKRMCSESHDLFKFWEITDNIL